MDAPQPLRALMETLLAARAAGDGPAIAALYQADGRILLPDGSCLIGREAIANHYQAPLRPGSRASARPAVPKFFFFPPVAHAIGSANGRHGEKHSFIDVLVQQDGGAWLLAYSSWTMR